MWGFSRVSQFAHPQWDDEQGLTNYHFQVDLDGWPLHRWGGGGGLKVDQVAVRSPHQSVVRMPVGAGLAGVPWVHPCKGLGGV